jgi:transcriptional regulator with GAF, ATPase, and Fis domain
LHHFAVLVEFVARLVAPLPTQFSSASVCTGVTLGGSMRREPWLHFWGSKEFAGRAEFAHLLAAAGIHVRPLDTTSPTGEGILCFSDIDKELYQFLYDASHDHDERILAVPVSDIVLESSQAWNLLHAGASDILVGCSGPDIADRIRSRFERWRAVDELLALPSTQAKLVGTSPIWRSILRQIVEVARFTDASLLLIGESGTGKELIARLIHELDLRATGREFVILDCTTIVPELSGSEFFGHERGAFTGAVAAREGAFALADGGTLFLDEVGELPMPLQAQLLRVVQEGTYKRIGSNTWHRTAFRLVCATNKDLQRAIENGEFRSDLYYRIAGWVFRIPPLNERREDILPLARYFLRIFRPDITSVEFEPPVQEFLLHRHYPGNVRDLRQLIARISSRHVGAGSITVGDIPEDERPAEAIPGGWRNTEFERCIRYALSCGAGLKEISQAAADTAMRVVVHEEHGNLQLAARRLGVTDRALQMRRAARKPHHGVG